MANILEKIDKLSAELKSLLPMSTENQQRLDKKFRLEFNYNSNHLEGNTLTYGETELLLIFDDTKGNHNFREYEEMKAHDVAFGLVKEWAQEKERPLTEQNIKNLNEIILVRPFWKDAITQDGQQTRRQIKIGNYKEYPNSVRLANGEIFHYASPAETPLKMQELIDWYRAEEDALHPVTLAAMLHYRFVSIHPFDDGNGRISRLLMNYVFLKNNLPPIIIKSDDKQNYLNALHLADLGDYEPFISYIGEQLAWSLEISIRAAKGADITEEADFQKEIELLKKKLKKTEPKAIARLNITTLLTSIFFPLSEKITKSLVLSKNFYKFHTARYSLIRKGDSAGYYVEKKQLLGDSFAAKNTISNTKSISYSFAANDPVDLNFKTPEWIFLLEMIIGEDNFVLQANQLRKAYNYGEYPTEADQKEFLQEAQQSFLKMLNENIN